MNGDIDSLNHEIAQAKAEIKRREIEEKEILEMKKAQKNEQEKIKKEELDKKKEIERKKNEQLEKAKEMELKKLEKESQKTQEKAKIYQRPKRTLVTPPSKKPANLTTSVKSSVKSQRRRGFWSSSDSE